MLARRVIACLDIRDGDVVKGVGFAGLARAGEPAALGARYDAEGIDELVLLDVSATLEARRALAKTIREVSSKVFIPLTVGGGIRSIDDARRVIEAGADKVSINTAAIEQPPLIGEIARLYGSQAVVVAIDARRADGRYQVRSRSATRDGPRSAIEWAREAEERGAGEILLTSIDRDGTRSGFDCEMTKHVCDAVGIPVIASGGAGTAEHFAHVLTAGGADAALGASIFHFSEHGVGDLKRFLASRGIPMRLDW